MDIISEADVMKGLECCSEYNGCLNCPFDDQRSNVNECVTKLSQETLNLINRRQSEYDALKTGYEIMKESSIKLKNQTGVIRAEAIKSFWMWLRDYAVSQTLFSEYEEGRMVVEYGDNLCDQLSKITDVNAPIREEKL